MVTFLRMRSDKKTLVQDCHYPEDKKTPVQDSQYPEDEKTFVLDCHYPEEITQEEAKNDFSLSRKLASRPHDSE